ncbi:ATP-binding cassette domain-containing protein [Brachybacterium sp. MASK1Z-5]|uniref:ATP-binding cassette domain-containing protein n=1 Tax=Brachybacterium halotolerans TaxID=2795215 RepID=A0ABS1B6M7_9MICO|nr:ATP-binding cassette domain-containing protein [Brachybacterium halotolerans]MBK0330157.1 ATP-binding cassette domain-containing protein [Brachybacterium halotolerans]
MIRAEHLVKAFSRPARVEGPLSSVRSLFSTRRVLTRAVDDVSLQIDDGEIVGYLGPNGAGKSTTIKMLTGILVPTAGNVEVEGIVPWKDRRANARNIGAVFGQRTQLWTDLPLRDSFELISRLYGLGREDYRRALDEFVDLLDMGPFMDTSVRSLSLGQRMRGDIVAAMLYRPPVLYLDEPTVGLDVVAKVRIREFIAQRNQDAGTTVLLTTHDIADIEQLAHRVVIIDEGRILYDGTLAQLRREYAPYREIVVRTREEPTLAHVGDIERTTTRPDGDDHLTAFRFDPERIPAPAAISRLSDALEVLDITSREPGVEDVIRRIYLSGSVGRDGR